MQRRFSLADKVCMVVAQGLQTVYGNPPTTARLDPSHDLDEDTLDAKARKHVAGLMRINHCGEVCAQALYQGQALTAKDSKIKQKMQQAAMEENDHLRWCRSRLEALDSQPSVLNPLWYLSSLGIGAFAGAIGDKWSLGFVAETEKQVVKHLDAHLQQVPQAAHKTRAVLMQMQIDEGQHATMAIDNGAAELPVAVKHLMTAMSKVMTKTVYYG